MNYYLSRLGRSKFGKNVVAVGCAALTTGYFCYQMAGHDLMRKLYVARYSDGEPIGVSDYLRDMITSVFSEVEKNDFHVDVLKLNVDLGKPTIRWFVSSTADPVVLGMMDFKSGISIGVPNSYNYRRPEDLPDYLFEHRRLSLFRWTAKAEEPPELSDEEKSLMKPQKQQAVVVRRIDRNSDEGKKYTDSLLLSDNAKKFSIARELYYCDVDRPLYHGAVIALTSVGAHVTGRASVQKLKLADRHVTHRLPGYLLSGLLYLGIYKFLSEAIEEYAAKKADEKAKKLGDDYATGAEELYTKRATRDDILGIRKKEYI